jgi:hypothetical protein
MPTSRWKQSAETQPDREYVVLASYLRLTSFNRTPYMLRHSRTMRGALADAPGLVGYSMKAKIPSKQYWTLSVWEGHAALGAFVGKSPHINVMALMKPDLTPRSSNAGRLQAPIPALGRGLRRLELNRKPPTFQNRQVRRR